MKHIKDVVIPETKKCLNSPLVRGEYFRVIGFILIMACYVGHSVGEIFFKDSITPQKDPPSSPIA